MAPNQTLLDLPVVVLRIILDLVGFWPFDSSYGAIIKRSHSWPGETLIDFDSSQERVHTYLSRLSFEL
jgi:hypothetical protein